MNWTASGHRIIALLGAGALALASAQAAPQSALRAHGSGPPEPEDWTLQRETLQPSASDPEVLLTGARFFPIQAAGSTRSGRHDPGRAAAVLLGLNLPALRLPGAVRHLLHYSRSADTIFGFLLIGPDGEAHTLVEWAAAQGVDPFGDVVGVAPDGSTLAVIERGSGQSPEAEGDCWLFDLSGDAPSDGIELSGSAAQDVEASSLTFFGGWLYAVAEDELIRAPQDGSTGFESVPIPGAGDETELIEELAVSGDGSTLAVLAGADEEFLDIFVLDALGTLRRITAAPAEIEEPGYLPDDEAGPYFALSHEGRFVMYLQDVGGVDELFVQATAPGTGGPIQITGDAQFDPALTEFSGVEGLAGAEWGFLGDGIGNPAAPRLFDDEPGIDSPIGIFHFFAGLQESGRDADLYQFALLESGRTELVNLSGSTDSSGTLPGNPGDMNVMESFRLGSLELIVDDQTDASAGFRLWSLDPSGATWLATDLSAPPLLIGNGDPSRPQWIAGLQTASAMRLFRFTGSSVEPEMLASVPGSAGLREFALNADGTRLALSVSIPPGFDYVVVLDLLSGQARFVTGVPLSNSRNLVFAGPDRLLFSADTAAGTIPVIAALPSAAAWVAGPAAPSSIWLR